MRRALRACFVVAVVLTLASTVAAQAAPAAAGGHKVSTEQVVRVYVRTIRYFNPAIDEDEARRIVAAIARESIAASVDPRLIVAIVATESSFDRTARSSAGARGLGQLMPATAADDRVTDVENVDQNIHGTVLTIKGNLDHYARYDKQRQYEFAIAAYNAGSGAVDEYHGVPPYDETVNYVWHVIALWRRLSGMSAT
jgi:soluble lytic murein transglycosylase-like protein